MSERVLLTGATGFIGKRLIGPLKLAGHDVVGMTRRADAADSSDPRVAWREGNLDDADSISRAMDGCTTAYFLVHALGTGPDYVAREERWARAFAEAAARAGVEHVIYLGAPQPASEPSRHMASRLAVGRILRESSVPTTELRASMVVGAGGASWRLVRALAGRGRLMTLPSWMESRTQPVSIDDAAGALVHAASQTPSASAWWELPGPDVLSAREILEITSELLSGDRAMTVYFPDLTPELTTRWLDVILEEDGETARELALGLTDDIVMDERPYWTVVGTGPQISFRDAARKALDEEDDEETGLPLRANGFTEIVRRFLLP